MKALTLHQPWASLCVTPRDCDCDWDQSDDCLLSQEADDIGGTVCDVLTDGRGHAPWKTIETRSWKAPAGLIGQRIAIHAGAKRPVHLYDANMVVDVTTSLDPRTSFRLWRNGAPMCPLPLGAVLGTAVLSACVPMLAFPGATVDAAHEVDHLCLDGSTMLLFVGDEDLVEGVDVSDQAPFGWFEAGRWAWVLSDVERFDEPVPARGFQGLWNWKGPR